MPLPVPRLSATIAPPVRRGEAGRVTIHGAPVEPPEPPPVNHAWHRCSRCQELGHNAKNKRCPAREVG